MDRDGIEGGGGERGERGDLNRNGVGLVGPGKRIPFPRGREGGGEGGNTMLRYL